MYLLYTALTLAAFTLLWPWFAYRAFRHGKYLAGLGQRLGRLPAGINPEGEPSIWIHAVSVGEVLTARALVSDLRDRYPGLKLFVSTTTATGQRVARDRLGGTDGVFYFPFDLPWVVSCVLDRLRPELLLIMETEIWPNLLRACRARGVRVALVNGRISSRSFPRYRRVGRVFRRVLANIDLLCMQGDESARRVLDLGAAPDRVVVTGSLKFDALEWPDASQAGASSRARDRVLRFFAVPASRPVVIAASTVRGEEPAVLAAFAKVRERAPQALLVVAPRHPERFDEVFDLARAEGFHVLRRTELAIDADPCGDVVVLDTIGELARVYRVATAVFVGGSLVNVGGHNILEPAVHGKAIVFGPYMQNFAEIAAAFIEGGAAVQVDSPAGLQQTLVALVADAARCAALGAAARQIVEANRGARGRTLEAIERVLPLPGASGRVVPFRRAR